MGAKQGRLRRAVNVGVDHSHALPQPRERHGKVGRQRRFTDPPFPTDRDKPFSGRDNVSATRTSATRLRSAAA